MNATQIKRTSGEEEPSTLRKLADAERSGAALLVWRSPEDDRDQIQTLADLRELTIGRSQANSLVIADAEVSRVHAQVELLGDAWAVLDDGISHNGTFVNGKLVHGRKRLRDGDVLRVGRTNIRFHDPSAAETAATVSAPKQRRLEELTPSQQRILEALCRPFANGSQFAAPASNREIADEVHLGLSSVRAKMRLLFVIFEIPDMPHNRKRARLAELAIASGLVNLRRS